MRRALVLVVAAAGLALAGCPSKPKNGECKTSQDCADQQGFGKVCVEGRCQECAADADCKEGFACTGNKCVPKAAPKDERAEAEAEAKRRAAEEEAARRKVPPECSDASAFTVRFAFDKSSLVPESQSTLQKLADCLKRAPAKRVTIAGNCDERGTTQYNIALGARRAESARKYLADLGVAAKLDTVSYGEEKPLCSEATEACWAKNRRDDFTVER